jgi:7-cyano-7-deazaguanine synthase in queuosine biosynthesis
MKLKKKIVILYSGGLDSFIMKELAKSKKLNYKLVYFDIGQEYNYKEIKAIKKIKEKVEIRKVEWITSKENIKSKKGTKSGNIFIPGRNFILASLAASIYLPDEIWLGGLRGEDHQDSTDKNEKFIDLVNESWNYIYKPFNTPKLVFPFFELNWGKFEATSWLYKVNKTPKKEILKTSSCLKASKGKNCGKCVVCLRRHYIFLQLGFKEKYETHPLTSKNNRQIVLEMINNELNPNLPFHYDKFRRREIIGGLKKEFKTNNLLKIKNKIKKDFK